MLFSFKERIGFKSHSPLRLRVHFLLQILALAEFLHRFRSFENNQGVIQDALLMRTTLRSFRLIAPNYSLFDLTSVRERLQEKAFFDFLQEMHDIDRPIRWGR